VERHLPELSAPRTGIKAALGTPNGTRERRLKSMADKIPSRTGKKIMDFVPYDDERRQD
jgi:hypothetical protein